MLADLWADNPSGIAPFSGRGPTVHERIKPDLVAPGTQVLGPRSRKLGSGANPWGDSSDPSYLYLGGTSTAAPLVAGAAAVVRQHLRTPLGHSPSAALVKAMLINAADDLPGQFTPSEAPGVPNMSEGWGRLNLLRTVSPELPERLEFHDEGVRLLSGQRSELHLQTLEAGVPLKVTLVWTDPPGERLQSDLDLIVRLADDHERHGNMPPGSAEFDRLNNVEQVVWEDFPQEPFVIEVSAFRTAPEGQTFALVIRGGI